MAEKKVARLIALLGDLGGYCLYAYGDSRGDQRACVNYPYYRTFQDAVEVNLEDSLPDGLGIDSLSVVGASALI